MLHRIGNPQGILKHYPFIYLVPYLLAQLRNSYSYWIAELLICWIGSDPFQHYSEVSFITGTDFPAPNTQLIWLRHRQRLALQGFQQNEQTEVAYKLKNVLYVLSNLRTWLTIMRKNIRFNFEDSTSPSFPHRFLCVMCYSNSLRRSCATSVCRIFLFIGPWNRRLHLALQGLHQNSRIEVAKFSYNLLRQTKQKVDD